ncbi:MAG: sigma-54-dependent Fis family transcriptional regulator [Bdellovibrionales bacterium]|nr:sigma-54-dependent Fis family transcriptional regulator [Bdellovibrionales bacterium]
MSGKLIHTVDPQVKRLLKIAENVAPSKATVLITGESGTGKELLARYIHSKSSRIQDRFFAVNCAALPENLFESELFGHEKGSFTGAMERKVGLFELASHGTFLLDEIGEMPLLLQSKLLRVLQEGEIRRIGGSAPINVNARIIATTHRDLAQDVKSGKFREDLYYRLNVIPLEIPALRDRPQDIRVLSQLFIEMSCDENGIEMKKLSDYAMNKILAWNWPGNIRELQNTMERTVLLTAGSVLTADDVAIKGFAEAQQRDTYQIRPGMTVSDTEKLLILKTLEHTGQNRTRAAELLGISIRTLRNKINEYKKENVL